jgi:hypothetical protein
MKTPAVLNELLIWARGRLALTAEEKVWLLVVLVLVWLGLTARALYKESQPNTPIEIEAPQEATS